MPKTKPKIFLAADHAGLELKEDIKKLLVKEGYIISDEGAYSYDENDDYPKFIFKAAKKVSETPGSKGIILGGSGQGEAIAANKVQGIRAALYYGSNPDILKLSKAHNDANILSLGARFLSKKGALEAVKLWLSSSFSNEERHKRRISQISRMEEKLRK